MSRLVDRAAMTVSGIPGTGDVVLNAAITGYRTFAASGVLNGDTVSYVIEDGTNWEFGYGTYTAVGTSLARSTVNGSSAAGAHVNFTNKATVFLSAFAADIDSGGAALTLHELADVNVTEGVGIDNFALVWNNATSRWVSQAQFSRAYADLTGKPTLFSGAYSDLTGKPTLFDGAYADLTGKPSLATVATSGAYSDLSGLPTLVTTLHALSDVTVTEGVGIDGYTLNWNNTAGKWEAVAPISSGSLTLAGLSDVSVSSQTNTEVLAWKTADTKWEALALGAVAYSSAYSDLTGKPSLATVATSGAYNDLTGKPTLVTALSGLSDVTVTEGAGIDTFLLYWNNAATKWEAKAFSYANISGAPSLATVATSGAYSDLSGLPTLITTLHGLSDVNVTEGAGIDGEFLKWNNATSKWVAATVSVSPAGSTTQVQYNSSGAFAGAAGFVFDGTSVATLGVAGTSVGGVKLANATSGTIEIVPTTGALGTSVLTLPAATGTLVTRADNAVAFTGGTIDGTAIGGTTPAAGAFTSLSSSADATIHSVSVGLGGGALSGNVAIGASALAANTTANNSLAVGIHSLQNNTIGSNNTALGTNSLQNNVSGVSNVGIGVNVLQTNTTGSNNIAIGFNALNLSTSSSNVAVGGNALSANSTGIQNVAIGVNALLSNTTANSNTGIGVNALKLTTTGGSNFALGVNALIFNVSGTSNTAIGVNALNGNVTGSNNVAIGGTALADLGIAVTAGFFIATVNYTINTVGTTDFTLIGAASNTVGVVFTATGVGSGTGTATPNATNLNTAIGGNTGRGIISGINNTIIGAGVTGLSANLSNAIIIATGNGTIRTDYNKTNAGNWTDSAPRISPVFSIGTLPTGVAGARCFVSDCSTATATFGTIAATGTGTVFAPVYYDGSNWRVG